MRDALVCVDEARGEKIFAKEIGLHGKRLFTVYTKEVQLDPHSLEYTLDPQPICWN